MIIIGFYKYQTIKSLKDELTSYKSECCRWFNKRKDINSIIVNSVGSNTFRAFNIKDGNRPSIIFRKWATESLGDVEKIKFLINEMNKKNYNDINYYVCNNLKKFWDSYLNPLSIYKARKLVNLLFKEIALEKSLTYEEKNKLISLLHLPIDKSTLNGIMFIFNSYEYKHNIGNLPSSASMGFIDSDLKYNTIQNFFIEIADELDVPPIYFDILFWNKNADNKDSNSTGEVSKVTPKVNIFSEETNKNINLTGIYTANEFLLSTFLNNIKSNHVKDLIKFIINELVNKKFIFKIKIRNDKAIAFTLFEDTSKNIVTIWTKPKKECIRAKILGVQDEEYSNTNDIRNKLIGNIIEKEGTI